MPAPGDDLAVEGNYAYVVSNLGARSQMVVVDVSVPTQPTITGTLAVAGGGINISGTYAYLVGDSFQVVDISDPAHPVLAGSCPTAGRDLYVVGNYAYVAGDDLWVLDIGDPANPSLLATYATSWAVDFSGVYAAGEYIYAVGDGLYILRLSELALEVSPASITWLAVVGGSDPPSYPVSIQSAGQPLTWTTQISPTVE